MTVPAGFTTRCTTATPDGSLLPPIPAALPVGIDFLGLPFRRADAVRDRRGVRGGDTHHRTPPPDFGPLDDVGKPPVRPKGRPARDAGPAPLQRGRAARVPGDELSRCAAHGRLPSPPVRRALLLILGLCAGLALAEIAVRVLDVPPRPLSPLKLASYRLSDDPVLRYEYRPNVRATDTPYDGLHRGLTTNSLGFRDVEFPVAKPPGELRILALGDSTTAGNGIPELDATWPKQLERRYADAGRPQVRVLNLGVGGYHPLQSARLLELEGLALEPDLVVLLVCLNDLDAGADGGVVRMLERVRDGDAAPGAFAALTRVSRLAFVVSQRVRAWRGARCRWRARAAVHDTQDPLADGLALLARLQRSTVFASRVFLLPGLERPFERYGHRALHERMQAIAARTPELPWIDLLDDFRATGASPRTLTVDGLHPNRAGATVLARDPLPAARRGRASLKS